MAQPTTGLDIFDAANIQDPYPLYARLRATAPVRRVGDSDGYLVSTRDGVEEATARTADFSSNLTGTLWSHADGSVTTFAMGDVAGHTQVLATADEPSHAAHRKSVLGRLAAKRINALEPFVAATAARLWPRRGDVEWMSVMADRLPMMVVAHLIGLPESDVERLIEWAYASTQLLDGLVDADRLAAAGVAAMELAVYLGEHFDRAEQQDSLLGDLASACASGDLSTDTALFILIQLVAAGAESTASLLGNAALVLADRPDVQHRLRDRPELLQAFIEEALRFESPFRGHYRHVLADTTLNGVDLPAGSRLLLLWGAANRDEAHFEDPDTFRIDRANAKSHLAFGKGVHFCVGAALARLEARVVLTMLMQRTSAIGRAGDAEWIPSLLVRRLAHLHLDIV